MTTWFDFDEAQREAFHQFMRMTLEGVESDVGELLLVLGSSWDSLSRIDVGDVSPTLSSVPSEGRPLVMLKMASLLANKMLSKLVEDCELDAVVMGALCCEALVKRVAGGCLGIQLQGVQTDRLSRSAKARAAANVLHDQPGGARAKQAAIREIWASGKYTSRDRCAEEEYCALGMSFSTARRALRKQPKPS